MEVTRYKEYSINVDSEGKFYVGSDFNRDIEGTTMTSVKSQIDQTIEIQERRHRDALMRITTFQGVVDHLIEHTFYNSYDEINAKDQFIVDLKILMDAYRNGELVLA